MGGGGVMGGVFDVGSDGWGRGPSLSSLMWRAVSFTSTSILLPGEGLPRPGLSGDSTHRRTTPTRGIKRPTCGKAVAHWTLKELTIFYQNR